MPQKNARKKLLITRNGPPPDVGPSLRTGRMGSEYPDAAIASFFHPGWTTRHSPPESPRTPEMLLGSMHAGSLMAEQQLSHHTHAPVRRKSHGDAGSCSCVHLAAPRCP